MQFRITWIEQDNPKIAQDLRIELGKSGAEVFAFPVTCLQQVDDLRVTKQRFQLPDGGSDFVVEGDRAHGSALRMRHVHTEFFQMACYRQIGRADLGKIMIFRSQPEHRNSAGFLGMHRGRERFQNAEQRSAKESYLLARNHYRCAVTESLYIGKRLVTGAEGQVLTFQNGGHGLATVSRICNPGDFVAPPLTNLRWAGIKGAYLRELVEVIIKQPAGVGNAAKRKTLKFHSWGLHHWHNSIGRARNRMVADYCYPSFVSQRPIDCN